MKTGEVIIVVDKEERQVRDRGLSLALKKGFELQKRAERIEADLDAIKALVSKRAHDALRGQRGSVSFQTGRLTLKVSSRQEAMVPEENISKLRRLLGRRFQELIRVKNIYTGSPKLIALADARISKLINIKKLRPRFNWQKR
jgi:hypothetical protein